jgi:hypothetical protein
MQRMPQLCQIAAERGCLVHYVNHRFGTALPF